ncbi:DUF2786 domain-containing protein [Nocardiopsis composta]|uniref:DUF2786 domain-containing protein n=1 Tax=Nocardiopsis composta TaxID=157465 RepID=A0A7W8VG05_9ACTN|nr:DUF2786 domain-containing protein [Nocardiopsis composta]MBB5434663.1 hypothetical protein [Nocardiopsis composta]
MGRGGKAKNGGKRRGTGAHPYRRARTKKERPAAPPERGPAGSGREAAESGAGGAERAAELVAAALCAAHAEDRDAFDGALAALADAERPEWAAAASRALVSCLTSRLARAWRLGWQPAEAVRQAARGLDGTAAEICADMVAAEHRARPAASLDPRWADQLAALGEGTWWRDDADYLSGITARHGLLRLEAAETALRLAALLESVPPLEPLLPRPGEPPAAPAPAESAAADPAKLARVRALLAKAESTEFPDEAEALSARAQELIARHSIDAALLAADPDGGAAPAAGGRRIPVDAPYEQHKASLLHVVAEANHCRAVWHDDLGLCTVVGHPDDVAGVELLFTSLLVQADTAMRVSGSARDRSGRAADRHYRASFLIAFTDRIADRLDRAAAEAEQAHTGRDLVPVFAARKEQVDAAVEAMFATLTTTRLRAPTDADGWNAGRTAADTAALHGREELG